MVFNIRNIIDLVQFFLGYFLFFVENVKKYGDCIMFCLVLFKKWYGLNVLGFLKYCGLWEQVYRLIKIMVFFGNGYLVILVFWVVQWGKVNGRKLFICKILRIVVFKSGKLFLLWSVKGVEFFMCLSLFCNFVCMLGCDMR